MGHHHLQKPLIDPCWSHRRAIRKPRIFPRPSFMNEAMTYCSDGKWRRSMPRYLIEVQVSESLCGGGCWSIRSTCEKDRVHDGLVFPLARIRFSCSVAEAGEAASKWFTDNAMEMLARSAKDAILRDMNRSAVTFNGIKFPDWAPINLEPKPRGKTQSEVFNLEFRQWFPGDPEFGVDRMRNDDTEPRPITVETFKEDVAAVYGYVWPKEQGDK